MKHRPHKIWLERKGFMNGETYEPAGLKGWLLFLAVAAMATAPVYIYQALSDRPETSAITAETKAE